MKTNFFLTGKRNIGKTYMINKIITENKIKPAGFVVVERINSKKRSFHFMSAFDYFYNRENADISEPFAWKKGPDLLSWEVDSRVFDEKGCKLLKENTEDNIIVMDELGRFELSALKFQEKVKSILASSTIVLGVIKDEKNIFLNKLRKRGDISLFRITLDNRDEIYFKLSQVFGSIVNNSFEIIELNN